MVSELGKGKIGKVNRPSTSEDRVRFLLKFLINYGL